MAEKIRQKSGERIAKVMARAGLCSRREAEVWIADGRVRVNDTTVTSPALDVSLTDSIVVDGRPLPQRQRTRLFLYHKPRNLVTTHADPEGRTTIFASLPAGLPRLISVGRLDFTTEGLLLLTNDGGLARVLELPATGWLRRYRVRAHGEVTQDALNGLAGGITVDGVRYGPIEATLDRVQGANLWLTFAIREGKNREVRKVLNHLGLDVNRLIRLSFGPFQLGELPVGAVEEVKTRVLREQLGEKLAQAAGTDFTGPLGEPGREASTSGGIDPGGATRPPRMPRPVRAGDSGPRTPRPVRPQRDADRRGDFRHAPDAESRAKSRSDTRQSPGDDRPKPRSGQRPGAGGERSGPGPGAPRAGATRRGPAGTRPGPGGTRPRPGGTRPSPGGGKRG